MRKTLTTIVALLPLLIVSATGKADDEPKLEGYDLAEKYYREIINRAMDPKRQARVEEDNRELWELIKRLFDKYPAPAVPDMPKEPQAEGKADVEAVPQPEESVDTERELNSTPATDEAGAGSPPAITQAGKAVLRDKAVVPAVGTEAADHAREESLPPMKTKAEPEGTTDNLKTASFGNQLEEIGTAIRQVRSRLEDLATELKQLEATIEALRKGVTESTAR